MRKGRARGILFSGVGLVRVRGGKGGEEGGFIDLYLC